MDIIIVFFLIFLLFSILSYIYFFDTKNWQKSKHQQTNDYTNFQLGIPEKILNSQNKHKMPEELQMHALA